MLIRILEREGSADEGDAPPIEEVPVAPAVARLPVALASLTPVSAVARASAAANAGTRLWEPVSGRHTVVDGAAVAVLEVAAAANGAAL